jgi:hypothetical protein
MFSYLSYFQAFSGCSRNFSRIIANINPVNHLWNIQAYVHKPAYLKLKAARPAIYLKTAALNALHSRSVRFALLLLKPDTCII